jgi:hypothetical protein
MKCRDGLPAICEVSVDGGERAERNESDGQAEISPAGILESFQFLF